MGLSPLTVGSDVHRRLAVSLNGEVWKGLEALHRTPEDEERLIQAAYASAYHWAQAGTAVNRQRGEWLIARVFVVLGRPEEALRHARRCLDLTEQYGEEMEDFDIAYALEGVARALTGLGRIEEARPILMQAREAGDRIAKTEDRQTFIKDFHIGDWRGLL